MFLFVFLFVGNGNTCVVLVSFDCAKTRGNCFFVKLNYFAFFVDQGAILHCFFFEKRPVIQFLIASRLELG